MSCPFLQLLYSSPVLLLANSCFHNVITAFIPALKSVLERTREVFISASGPLYHLPSHSVISAFSYWICAPYIFWLSVKCSAQIQVSIYSAVPCLVVRFSLMGKKNKKKKKSLCCSLVVPVSNHCQNFHMLKKKKCFALANTTCFHLIHWVLETKFILYSPHLPMKMGWKQLLTQFIESTDCSQQTCNS